MESLARGLNSELISITEKIARIEATLDEWERTRKPMIFIEDDLTQLNTMESDTDSLEVRANDLKKQKKELENEMPSLRNQ
tara:strand:- start:1511 stop:1753 length:243 start_codon:yes stop_codon:yes gene_type:complete